MRINIKTNGPVKDNDIRALYLIREALYIVLWVTIGLPLTIVLAASLFVIVGVPYTMYQVFNPNPQS